LRSNLGRGRPTRHDNSFLDTSSAIQILMPREAEPSLNEKQFVLRALEENFRTDGRSFDQFRELELNFGDEYGVADVKLGKTRSVQLHRHVCCILISSTEYL